MEHDLFHIIGMRSASRVASAPLHHHQGFVRVREISPAEGCVAVTQHAIVPAP
jgi:hypothetical protein